MSWGLWVRAGDVIKEGVPALMDEVANVGKACATGGFSVLDFMEPAHSEDTSSDSACGMPVDGSSPSWSLSRSMSKMHTAGLARLGSYTCTDAV